jgi:hypothetical protein
MSNFIQNLRNRPLAYRKRFAFLLSAIVAGIAFCIFLIIFSSDFSDYADAKAKEPKGEGVFSKMSKSYNAYKKNFDDSPLAKQMEDASFVAHPGATSTPDSSLATTSSSTSGTTYGTTSNSGPIGPNNAIQKR